MNAMAERSKQIARSPKMLKPLIEQQVRLGYQAGTMFFKQAGLMLLEARESITAPQLWSRYVLSLRVDDHPITTHQAKAWMRLGRSEQLGLGHRGVEDAKRDPRTRSQAPTGRPFGTSTRATSRELDEETQENKEKRHREFREHRRAERAEMLLLVAAGYKQLALKRHPDKGGSSEAMHLLREARDILMKYAEAWS